MPNQRKGSMKRTLTRLLSALMVASLVAGMMPVMAFAASGNKAVFTKSTIPATMAAGQTYTVQITVKNTGTTTWTAKAGYHLVPVGGSDPFTTIKGIALDAKDSIKPNGFKTFTLTLTAPLKSAKFTTDWQMAKGKTKFGKVCKQVVTVKIASKNSLVTKSTAPKKIVAGTKFTFTVTFKNTGSSKWTAAKDYQLIPIGKDNDAFFDEQSYSLKSSDSIKFGKTKTFTITLYAPVLEGSYSLGWQLYCGSTKFGAAYNTTIKVYYSDAQKLQIAETAVKLAEQTHSQQMLDIAQGFVDALPNGPDKKALQARIDAEQAVIDEMNEDAKALAAATASVEAAEQSLKQADVDAAQALVTALPDSAAKTALQVRLNAVQAIIDLNAAKAAAHDALAQAFAGYSQADYTDDNWAALTSAKDAGDMAIDTAVTEAGVTAAEEYAEATMASIETKDPPTTASPLGSPTPAATDAGN